MGRLGGASDWWSAGAIRAGALAAELSRRCGLGDGSIIGGRVIMRLAPSALRRLARGRRIALVSGTNGKTTTSHLLAAALRGSGAVAHNATGSNMTDGAVTALAAAPDAPFAVLEVDEWHLAEVADAVRPDVVVLLNLSRDQLDRGTEVRAVAAALSSVLIRNPRTTVVANADDPLVVWATGAARTVWVAAGASWTADTAACPRCGDPALRQRPVEGGARWRCPCGLARPTPAWTLLDAPADGDAAVLETATGQTVELPVRLPGRFNRSNAAMALVAAVAMGAAPEAAAAAMADVESVAGRYAVVSRGQQEIRLLLAKNPAGWSEMMPVLDPAKTLLVAINAREADGRDTSWLWDVPFEQLRGRAGAGQVIACGEHAGDIGLRLGYADVDHDTVADPLEALAGLPPGKVDIVANYTAFHTLHRHLSSAGATEPARPRTPRTRAPGPHGRPAPAPQGESALTVAVVSPETLGTYSDAGNAHVLVQRARWRGIDARVLLLPADGPIPLSCDVYLLGGGEDTAQMAAARWLTGQPGLCRALSGPAVTLAICAGFQLLGHTMTDRTGRSVDGLGLIDAHTTANSHRAVGEVVTTSTIPGVGRLTGFENHQGHTVLGADVTPLGHVESGTGNGPDRDGRRTDGAVVGRIIGTYMHGPVLARNPALADHILSQVTGRALEPLELPDQPAVRRTYLGG